jgi:hypothetical protein
VSGLANANAAQLPYANGVFHCVVSSIPYWGLRAYTDNPPQLWGGDPACAHKWKSFTRPGKTGGHNSPKQQTKGAANYGEFASVDQSTCTRCGAWLGSYGLEPTLEQYVANTVLIMREVARVMRDDAVLWLNIGDCYATQVNGRSAADGKATGQDDRTFRDKPFSTVGNGLKPKDMCGVPWRVALALQADGWWLRRDVIWSKPNPMPESISDRPATSHEYIFMLTKAEHYYFDMEAVREPVTGSTHTRISQNLANQVGSFRANGGNKTNGPTKAVIRGSNRKIADTDSGVRANHSFEGALALPVTNRNLRSVWTIATQPYSGAHFATYPDALAERCILASTSAVGVCAECGASWARVTEREFYGDSRKEGYQQDKIKGRGHLRRGSHSNKTEDINWKPPITTRWAPTCAHDAPTVPARVLDPFVGSGTTVAAARRLGRRGYGADLSLTYLLENALPRAMGRNTDASIATLPLFGGTGGG